MLVELMVENYAVVERLRVRFYAGLNLLTGETGSGKSLVVDALGLLLGGRASADVIRAGADRARVAAIFELPPDPALERLLAESGFELDGRELLVEREILAGGKSRAFISSRPATVALLRELAPYLGDIHGQHDQQRLFAAEAQLEMLDAFAGHGPALAEIADLYARWRRLGAELAELERSEQERLRLADLWTFQRREIESAAPAPGEDAALEAERRVLANVVALQEHAAAAYEALYDSAGSALAQIRQARRRLEEICRIDPDLVALRDSLRPAEVIVEEAAHELRHYLGRLEADPARLEQIEARLAALDKLKRKYGPSLEEVLAFLEQVRSHLEAMESAEERRAQLEAQREEAARRFAAAAARLSESRREAAARLEKRVEAELRALAMERAAFRVDLQPSEWTARGTDRVTFLIAANPGEPPRPLDKVASGGELSRIALALKTSIAAAASAAPAGRTLVFDEVDSGVGGSAAETVGRRLKQLAAYDQVLCVTHLPQIAGFADHHYHVAKREVNGRTVATVEELTGEARVREIGRMLSGRRLTEEALRQAEQLIRLATA
jgi:DNA repair protein RecN (Recombination protein N)